jgi:histidinol-phosphate aminotransferase
MKSINRRSWLKAAGMTGAAAFSGWPVYGESKKNGFSHHNIHTDLFIQLNANENPYGPSQVVRESLKNAFDDACRYPFKYIQELRSALAEKEKVSPDHIVISAGSWEALKITGLTYGLYGGEIIAADPTYQSLLSYADQFGAQIIRVPVDDQLNHDLPEMEKRITSNTRLIFICNPNNPTGTIIESNTLRDFCVRNSSKSIIFSDEAYYDYVEEKDYPSMVELVKEGMNVIVSRTFSKVYAMAGLRVGYLVTRPDMAERINRNVPAGTNVLAIKAALAALKDNNFYEFSLLKNKEAKEYLYSRFEDMGIKYMPSHTNFVFFHSGRNINDLINDMRQQNVLIGRPFPPLTDWCRISTGTIDDMKKFITGLEKVI